MSFKQFLHTALDFIFPPLCHVCRTFIPDAGCLHICPVCHERLLPIVSPLCVVCGFPYIGVGEDHICGRCITSRHPFDVARAAFVYEGINRDLIHAFKYCNKTHLRRPLALLTIERLSEFVRLRAPDLIIPVPLHKKRLRKPCHKAPVIRTRRRKSIVAEIV
jgi:predicted amidophosphoribosyltransferase